MDYKEIIGCKQQLVLGMELKDTQGNLVTVIDIHDNKMIPSYVYLSQNGRITKKISDNLVGWEIL